MTKTKIRKLSVTYKGEVIGTRRTHREYTHVVVWVPEADHSARCKAEVETLSAALPTWEKDLKKLEAAANKADKLRWKRSNALGCLISELDADPEYCRLRDEAERLHREVVESEAYRISTAIYRLGPYLPSVWSWHGSLALADKATRTRRYQSHHTKGHLEIHPVDPESA